MFFQTLLVGALASLAVAQSTVLSFDRVPNPVTAGQPQALTYLTNDTTTPVSIILRKGASGNLDTIATLTDDATGGQYIWTPSNSLENDGDYALEIRQGTQVNYFGPFTLQGSTEEASSSSSSATGTATSSSSRSGVTAPATYPAGNSTATAFGTGTAGTGSPITRNTTMSSATLRPTSSSSQSTTASTTTPSDLQASATASGAASSLMAGGSAIALVLGAVGAIVMG